MKLQAKKKPYSYEVNGRIIHDDYFWLRDKNWPEVKDPEILEYLNAENKNAEDYFKNLKDLKDTLFEELKGRITLKDMSVPVKKGNYYYYTRIEEISEYPLYCRKACSGGFDTSDFASLTNGSSEEIILNIPELAKDQAFFSVGTVSVSPDHKFLAYSVDDNGSERYKIKVKNLETGEYFSDEIEGTFGSIVWREMADIQNYGFFYTPTDSNWRHLKLYYHQIGEDSKHDRLIYEEKDQLYNVSASKSSSRRFLLINISGHGCNEVKYIDFSDPEFQVKLIRERKDGIFYDVEHNGDYFYIHSNDAGRNFRIARAHVSAPDIWEDFIAHDENIYISSFDVTSNYLLLNKRKKASPLLEVMDLKSLKSKNPSFDLDVAEATIYSTNFEEDDIRVDYSSFVKPDITSSYNYDSEKLELLKKKKIPSGFDGSKYTVERLFVLNAEVKIPVTLFYKRDQFKQDGSNPLYLYGYGSYGHRIPVNFRTSILSLVDRGIIFAIAHVRGGDDLGFDWYESAKFLNKKHTFEDYIKISEYLIEAKYTSAGNLIASGGSAGGMLVGAVLNMRPELFKLGILHVPFVDVLNTMLDESLPLTPGEFKEWGNPKEAEYFEYIKSYSPYDNIRSRKYPAIFVTAGLSDPRVGYWEAAKWVAKLREVKMDDNIIIFKTNMDYGHKGASGRFAYLHEVTEEYAFVLNSINISI